MPGLVKTPAKVPSKRVLQDLPASQGNIQPLSPAKKRKLNGSPRKAFRDPKGVNGHAGSSQPKSQFEEEVLEKLTQDMGELKQKNSEKDQQWTRPSLDDFDEKTDSLCFQQIDAEEGTLHGGKTTVKLFGVTEVRRSFVPNSTWLSIWEAIADIVYRPATLSFSMSPTSFITFMSLRRSLLPRTIAIRSKPTSRLILRSTSLLYIPCRWCSERISLGFKETRRVHI